MRNKKHTRKNKITTAPVVTKDKTTTAAGQSLEANTSIQLTTDQLNHLKQLMECVNSADATRFISTLDNIKQTYPHDLVKFLSSRAFTLNSNTTETTGYPSLYLTLKSVGAIRKICISSYLLSHLVTSGAHILARAYIRPDIAAQAHEFWSVIITYAPELLTMPVYESGLMLNAAHTTHRTPLHPPLLFFIIDHTNPEANEPLERIKQELSTKLYQTYGLDAIFHLKAGIPDNRLETSTAAGSAPNDWMFNTHLTDASIRFQYAIFQQHNLLLQSVYKGTDDKHKVQCDKNFTTLNRMLDSLKKHRLFGYTADQLCEELKSTKENAYNSVSLMQDWKTVNNALNQIQWITEQFKHAEPYNQRLKQRLAEEQKTINALWNATFEIRLNYLQKNMQIECTLRQAILSRNSEIEKRDQLIRNLSSQAQSVTQLKQLYKALIKDNLQLNNYIHD